MKRYIYASGLALLCAAIGFSIRSEYVYQLGKQDGKDEFIQRLRELEMELKTTIVHTNSTTLEISNASSKTITVTLPNGVQWKEAK